MHEFELSSQGLSSFSYDGDEKKSIGLPFLGILTFEQLFSLSFIYLWAISLNQGTLPAKKTTSVVPNI